MATSREKLYSRLLFFFIVLVMGICIIAISTVKANAAALPDYNPGDIAVINSIINNNGLEWDPGDPSGATEPTDWTGYVEWSSDSSDKRITYLNISGQGLHGNLDVSGLTNLTELYCSINQLEDLGTLPNSLTYLDCWYNQLDDIGPLPNNLTYLYCGSNNLTDLDVSGLTSLTLLACNNNQLTDLDVSGLTSLTYLGCSNNQLTDLGTLPNSLQILVCGDNQLTDLNVAGLTNLLNLDCRNNNLTDLGILPNNLNELYCFNNLLTDLDLTGLNALTFLISSGNPLRNFVPPSGDALNITPTSGVVMGIPNDSDPWRRDNFGYNLNTGEITLSAIPGTGRTFEKWTLPAGAVLTNGTTLESNPVSFTLNDNMTVTPVFKYDILSDLANYTNDGKDRVFSVDGDIAYYTETTVNGKVTSVNAKSGSTIITIPASYLSTLALGTHDVRVLFTDGYAATTLGVTSVTAPADDTKPANPKTADATPLGLLISLISLMAIAGAVLIIGRRVLSGATAKNHIDTVNH